MNNWNATIDTASEKICINVSGKLYRLQYNIACENHQIMFIDQQKQSSGTVFTDPLVRQSKADYYKQNGI
jgi:transposase-like protein